MGIDTHVHLDWPYAAPAASGDPAPELDAFGDKRPAELALASF